MYTVNSKDGTSLAYDKMGSGPAVVLIDGAFCSRKFGPMAKIAALLSEKFTVITYDRRARGGSGDTPLYSIEREIEDLLAMIEEAGGSAHLFGISSGAILAIRAVASGLPVSKLALFEPPFVGNEGNRRPDNAVPQLVQMIKEGKRGKAVSFYLKKVMGLPAIIALILRLTPNWPKMKSNANSLPYDAVVCGDFKVPDALVSEIDQPVLVIDSKKSPQSLREAVRKTTEALRNARRISLMGKVHDVPAKVLVPVLTAFFENRGVKKSIPIDAGAGIVWDVLTNPDKIIIYLFGSQVATDWKVGSPVTFTRIFDGRQYQDKGRILESVEGQVLKFSYWSSQEGYEDIAENYSVISYRLETNGDGKVNLYYYRENIPTEFERKNQEKYLPGMLKEIKRLAEGK